MRLATWNIESMLNMDYQEKIDYVSEYVAKCGIDVICLQEVITSGCNYINDLQKRLNFRYCSTFELSSAHLSDSSLKKGIAILSRYEILNEDKAMLTNPHLSYRKDGNIIKSDDKGFLVVHISYQGTIISIATGQMLSFSEFGKDAKDYKHIYKEMYDKVKSCCNDSPFILCGDFNTSQLDKLINYHSDIKNVFSKSSRVDVKQKEYICVSPEFIVKSHSVIINKSGHPLYICDFQIRSTSVIHILHLSDTHFCSRDHTIDQKTNLQKVNENDVRKNQLINRIEKIPHNIDYVIVSGDITTAGKEEGFDAFGSFVQDLQNKKKLPASNRFVIVPGNHDVRTGMNFENFTRMMEGSFVRPWIEGIDKEPNELIDFFSTIINDEIKDIYGYAIDEKTGNKIHLPFLLNTEHNILIYAFNSSSISRTTIKLNESDSKIIEKIKSKSGAKDAKEVIAILEKELMVDPARIDPQEFHLFNEIVKKISEHINISTFYKIAVLHHHISTISTTEEIKKFDYITNAGQFKKMITDAGFQIAIHGHKHSPMLFHDAAIENNRNLLVVSGGTIFGFDKNNDNGFFFHTIDGNTIKSTYISLRDEINEKNTVTKMNGDTSISNGIVLSQLFKTIETEIVQHIYSETIEGKQYTGWSKNLLDKKVGVISTAYGLLILEKLKSYNSFYIKTKEKIINTLWQFRHQTGGWGALSQSSIDGSPEATAWVTLALFSVQSPLYTEALNDLNEILNKAGDSINSNFTLALLVGVLCEVDSSNPYIPQYCQKLMDNAVKEKDEILYWCSKCQPGAEHEMEPSVVHTACAVLALYASQKVGALSVDLKKLLSRTKDLLLDENGWGNTHETIANKIGKKEDRLIVQYYTIAWVIRALLVYESHIDVEKIQRGIDLLLKDYKSGFWNYEGNKYIWAVYDALCAIIEYVIHK